MRSGCCCQVRAPERVDHFEELRGQERADGGDDVFRQIAMEGFGDGTRDGGERVGVAAERDGETNGVLGVRRFEECDQRLRDRALARFVECVSGADAVDRAREVVSETRLELGTDRGLRCAVTRPKDGERDGLRAPDSLGVVVGDGGALLRLGEDALGRVERETDGADAHGRPVAEAAVGARLVVGQPLAKPRAVPGARVAAPELEVRTPVGLAREDGAGLGNRQDGVVGEAARLLQEREVHGLVRAVLVRRADDVPGNGSDHRLHFDGRHRTSDVRSPPLSSGVPREARYDPRQRR
jgi:hypothetical protein